MDLASDAAPPGFTLRPPIEDDVDAIAAAVRASLPELMPWMPWATGVEAHNGVGTRQWMRGEAGDRWRFVMIDRAGELVGCCGLNRVDDLNRSANLGYWVRSDQTGRGYASAATRSVARFGLGEAGLNRIEITMSVRNLASRRVAEKAGAQHEGIARAALLLRGEFHDAHTWSFVASDLDPPPAA